MKLFKVLKNEEGTMAMLGAMMFSIAITTTLSTFYVYTVNQSRYHARIKEAYQLMNIMESFATATRKSYEMGMSAAAADIFEDGVINQNNCPEGTLTQIAGTSFDYARAGGGTISAPRYYCNLPNAETCFERKDTGDSYCTSINFATNEISLMKQEAYAKNTLFKDWRKGLNHFYLSPGLKNKIVDTARADHVVQRPRLLDWLTPQKAHAQGRITKGDNPEPVLNNDDGESEEYYKCTGHKTGQICGQSDGGYGDYPTGGGGGGYMPQGTQQPGCRAMDASIAARLCNSCGVSGTLCSQAGSPGNDDREGPVVITRTDSEGNQVSLPVLQRFSIIMQ